MGCVTLTDPHGGPNIIVCVPESYLRRRILTCGTCRQRRRFVEVDTLWYGVAFTCCGCGDTWTEEGRKTRPARRGWRKEATAEARRKWNEAGPNDTAKRREWIERRLT